MPKVINRQHFTEEFKKDAVSLVIDQKYSCAEVARRLGISENNVNRWVRVHRDHETMTSRMGRPEKTFFVKTGDYEKKIAVLKWSVIS